MTTKQEKQLRFLNGTVKHFNSKNRSISSTGLCQYQPVKGKSDGCAIGRHIKDKELCRKLDNCIGFNEASVNDSKVFNSLPAKLKELGKTFLINVQSLHDQKENWDEKGLSETGKYNFLKIKKNFKLK